MADYIPFVNSEADSRILRRHYGDARVCRVALSSIDKLKSHIPANIPLWVDPGIDAYHHFWGDAQKWPVDIYSESPGQVTAQWPRDDEGKPRGEWKFKLWQRWKKQFSRFHAYRLLTHDKCWQKKYEEDLNHFVAAVLEACMASDPQWVTIPQLPVGKGRSRVNRRLAEATGIWKQSESRNVRLILPLIITTASTLAAKPSRDNTLKLAMECRRAAGAHDVWVVDTSLSDQYRNDRFPSRYEKLVDFHEALGKSLLGDSIVVGGPYWGINLVLWARGLCDSPAISLGTTYTYHISCGQPTTGNIRVAIPPLRRWVISNADLADWLDLALDKLSPTDTVYTQLSELRRDFHTLRSKDAAADQVARFFKEWLTKIESVSRTGRALALYQDLSSAFVLGRQLPQLPKAALPGVPRKVLEPGKVAEQLMLHCL